MTKVTKIGLLNFWYFDEEVFEFSSGKLLLRGGNGSGKSVTMQSFIPLILDGNKTPSRLDPFGTKEKRIEDYLLGTDSSNQKDETISYLYMEVFNEEKNKYITIGIGFHARKGRNTDFWGFGIKDGKRIGIDYQLYKNYGAKVLMTKKELKALLGSENILVETQKEYKSMVNDLLFGFNDIDSYDEFISVLLQLRSPKLSKEYNPVKLMNILSGVLQPLSSEDIRPLSSVIEDNKKTKERIEVLKNNIKALNNLTKVYQNYNEIILYNKTKKVVNTNEKIKATKRNIKEKENNITSINEELITINNTLFELESELTKVETYLNNVDNSDIKNYTNETSNLESLILNTNKKINELKTKIEVFKDKANNYNTLLMSIDKDIYELDKIIYDLTTDITNISGEIYLEEIVNIINNDTINFEYLISRINKYKSNITIVKTLLEEKEKYEKDLSDKENNYEQIKKDIDSLEKNKTNYYKELTTSIDNFKDKINTLFDNKLLLNIGSIKTKIFDLINDYTSSNYIKSKELYMNEINLYKESFLKDKYKLESKINECKEELKHNTDLLEELKNNKELEYLEDESIIKSNTELNNLNIPFIPLYKVIEFKDSISLDERNRIEELLILMNILNAKIVSNKYLDKVTNIKSVFLKKGIKKTNNLLKYVNVLECSEVPKKEIIGILESISTNELDNEYISKDKFVLDFLIGYPSNNYTSKYIGVLNRIKEQSRLIKEKEEEINELNEIINGYTLELDKIINNIEEINYMLRNYPSNEELDNINTLLIEVNISLNDRYNQRDNIANKINELNNQITIKMEEINKLKSNNKIPLNLISYNEVLTNIDILLTLVNDLEKNINKKILNLENKKEKTYLLEDTNNNISEYEEEIYDANKSNNEYKTKLKAINDILNSEENKKIIENIREYTELKNSIPKENNRLREKKGKLESNLDNINSLLQVDKDNLNKYIVELDLYNSILNKELCLHYVYKTIPDENTIINDLKIKENSDLTSALDNYLKAYNTYKLELLDYRLNNKDLFNNEDTFIKEYSNENITLDEIKEITKDMKRNDLECIYQGRKLNIYELSNELKTALEESQNYISEQEHKLFTDILLKTVGSKIRDRINSSKEWVQKMNEIMRSTGKNSNLSFELEWVNKTAFVSDEIDTKELIRIFRIDPGQLTSTDKEKLQLHFLSKIKRELEFNPNETYTNIIFNVLDYRNWFEFKLYYKRIDGNKKELNNRVYACLSGGERAKSMYIPLFAAVYAKLLSARNDSLRLIALDEAFAGVDNDNIREMFDILSHLELDYILTSQVLWGDYETVKDLSICELIKDEVEKCVGVRHYHWNGLVKEYLE